MNDFYENMIIYFFENVIRSANKHGVDYDISYRKAQRNILMEKNRKNNIAWGEKRLKELKNENN